MLRRDYILNQIEEFAAVLAKILGFTNDGKWPQASAAAAEEFQRLIGTDVAEALQLSESELFARLIRGEATQVAERKVFMLALLFKATGDIAAGQGQDDASRALYLKGLDLLLHTLDHTAIGERPDFVPTVEAFFINLSNSPLPTKTKAMLMRHYERAGDFARAEDALFAIAKAEPPGAELLEFGEAFYRRLLAHSDTALVAGRLNRQEVEEGLVEFRALVAAPPA